MNRTTGDGPARPVEERLKALFVRGLDGDAAAYQVFLGDLTGHLRGFLRKRLFYLQDDIEDLVQEILMAVHNGRHTYRRDQPLTAWVHAIARYKLADFFRARSRREALHMPLDDELEIFATCDVARSSAPADSARKAGGAVGD
jgi:RNA polymerase sigma-70 factor (ECF subfamily)